MTVAALLVMPFEGNAEKIVTEYGYESAHYEALGLATSARAFPEGNKEGLLGEAKLIKVKGGAYVEVEETHFSSIGKVIYKARSKFSIISGEKISEEAISGRKKYELFKRWPIMPAF